MVWNDNAMKKIILLLAIALITIPCYAQTPAEWLNQQNTQTRYLQQQIALFRLYSGYVQKGYSIAQKCLATIGHTQDQEWELHAAYISSLEKINPVIRNAPQITAILSWQKNIHQTCQSTWQQVMQSGQLHPAEIDYVRQVMANLLRDSAGDIAELLAVITPAQWEMTDDERLKRLDALYEAMQDKQALLLQVAHEAKVLSRQRMREKKEISTSRSLNGFKKE
jgi:hypothetical protein